MSVLSVQPTFLIFTEADGQPLENGYIWIGTANLDPQVNPISVYWDAALTQPAAQPIRTINGYPAKSGAPGRLYVNSDYSIRVQNKNGSAVYSAPAATDGSSEFISFIQNGAGAVQRSVQSKLRDVVSVKDFGAIGDGVTNDANSFLNAHNAAGSTAFILVPNGTYLINSAISVTNRYFLLDGGTITNSTNLTGANIVALSNFAKTGINNDITSLTSSNLKITQLESINNGQIAGRRNKIINGNFDVWQLGSSINITGHLQKIADRWNYDYNGTIGTLNISRYTYNVNNGQPVGDGWFPRFVARLTMSVAPSGNTFQDFSTQIESVKTLAGRQITISFYARSLSGGNQIIVKTEQYFGGGGSPSSPVFNTSSPILISNSSWARYTVTFTMQDTIGKTLGSNGDDTLNVILSLPINQTFDLLIGGVQIEQGPVATPFEETPYADTYSMCQRYLQSSYDDGTAPGTATTQGALAFQAGGVNPITTIQLKTPMRVLPYVTYYNPATGAINTWNDGGIARNVTTNTNGTKNISVAVTGSFAGNFISGHYVVQDPYY